MNQKFAEEPYEHKWRAEHSERSAGATCLESIIKAKIYIKNILQLFERKPQYTYFLGQTTVQTMDWHQRSGDRSFGRKN